MILYLLYRMGVFFALILPVKFSYFMACLFADGFYCISAKDRKAVTDNLSIIMNGSKDEKTLRGMARQVFRNFAKYLVDFFRFQIIDEDYVKKFVRISGENNMKAALAMGKGAIALSAHIGNWELGGSALSLAGYPVSAVVLTHQNRMINDFFTHQRLKGKVRPIEIGATLKSCYKILRSNNILALLGDRDFTKSGLVLDFFGRPAQIPRGPAAFSYRIGSAIVPTFMIRQPDDTFTLFMEEPILPDPSETEDAAIVNLTKKYLSVIESYIKAYPTQWHVFRNIWSNNDKESLRPDTII